VTGKVADIYPFVLSQPAVEKLRFVHETVEQLHAIEPGKSRPR